MISLQKEEPWKRQRQPQSRDLGLHNAEDSAPWPSNDPRPQQKFCFIDEQRLRQPGENPFRRAVRSQARRATDQRRQRFNATIKAKLGNPRKLLVKSLQHSDAATLPHTDIPAATPQLGGQLVVGDNGIGMRFLIEPNVTYVWRRSRCHIPTFLCIRNSGIYGSCILLKIF